MGPGDWPNLSQKVGLRFPLLRACPGGDRALTIRSPARVQLSLWPFSEILLAQPRAGEAGEVPEVECLRGGRVEGLCRKEWGEGRLGTLGQSVGTRDWEGFLVAWV